MPKRPIQHRLEDKSRVKFQDILPEMWVYRDKNKDYGIDGEVELFDQNERAQGLFFYVQLKATKSKEKSKILNVNIEIDTLKYYKSLDIPVLLVRYSDFDNSIYVKWINNIDLFFAKDGAKTIRIKLSENDKWDSSTHTKIENYLKKIRLLKSGSFGFPIPISITINENKVNGFSNGILNTKIKRELKKYLDFITILNNPEKSLIEINIDNDKLKIDISNLAGCSFHSIGLRKKENFAKNISKDILIGIALGFIQLGKIEYCGRIIFENNLKKRLIEKKELLLHFVIPLIHSSYFKETLSIIEEVLDNENNFGLDIISSFHMLLVANTQNEEKNMALENFFKNQIIKAESKNDKQQIGIANYNLGNHYSNRDEYLKAISHFNLARKFASIYLKQAYFHSEIASVLFRYGKYKFASIFYSNSLCLNQNTHTIALYADSLMFSGEYEKASKLFDEYIEKAKTPIEEFILKSILLNTILDKYKIKTQNRNQNKANKYGDIVTNKICENPIQQLEKALEFDLLSGLAWFNLGIIHSKENNFDDAVICFSISALINNGDIEAWKNATLSAFNSKEVITFLPLIIRTAYFFNREEYLEELYLHLENQNQSASINQIIETIENILPEKEKNTTPTVRILNKKEKFESIDEIIKGHNERRLKVVARSQPKVERKGYCL